MKKNKSSIKYGNYIYNELKEKQKTKSTDNRSTTTNTNFLSIIGTVVNEYRKYFTSVFTLGGYPIDDNAYNRNTSLLRKSLQTFFDDSNTKIDYSNYDINTDLTDYFSACEAQDSIIEASFSNYEVTEDEFMSSVYGLTPEFLQQINDDYNNIRNNSF